MGQLLWEHDRHEIDRDGAELGLIIGRLKWFLAIGATLGLLVAFFASVKVYSICLSLAVGAVLLFYGAVRFYLDRWRPQRIYENGFRYNGIIAEDIFVPWAAASSMEVKRRRMPIPIRGRTGGSSEKDTLITVHGIGQTSMTFNIGRTEVDHITSVAASQVGKSELVPRWYELQLERRFILAALFTFIFSLLMAVLLTGFMAMFGFVLGDGSTGIFLALILLTIALFGGFLSSSTSGGWGRPSPILRLKVAATFVISVLLVAVAIVGVRGVQSMDYEDPGAIEYTFPGPSAIRMGYYNGQHFDIEEPVSIHDGQALVLENCSVRFNLPEEEDFGFWVEKGGRLELRNTSVTTSDKRPTEPPPGYAIDSEDYLIEVHGSAWIEACLLELLGGWRSQYDDGGLKIFSDDVTVLNTTVRDPYVNGIVTVDCSPTIDGCIVLRAPKDGIQCHGGSPIITTCLIRNCTRGIVLHDSDARIEECEVEGGNVGVYMIQSAPSIETLGVKGTREAAVICDYFSDPSISNLILMENERGVVKDRWVGLDNEPLAMQMDGLCIPLFLVVGLMSLVPFLKELRRRPRHPKDPSTLDSENSQRLP